MNQLLWIQKKTSARPKKSSMIFDAPKIDYFWVLPDPQIPKPLVDITAYTK